VIPRLDTCSARSAPLRPTRVYLDNEDLAPFPFCTSSLPCTRVARALSDQLSLAHLFPLYDIGPKASESAMEGEMYSVRLRRLRAKLVYLFFALDFQPN
jgi:hypothetical protein